MCWMPEETLWNPAQRESEDSRVPPQPLPFVCMLRTDFAHWLAERSFQINLESCTSDISLDRHFIGFSTLPKSNFEEAKPIWNLEPKMCSLRTKVPVQIKPREVLGNVKPASPGSVSVLKHEKWGAGKRGWVTPAWNWGPHAQNSPCPKPSPPSECYRWQKPEKLPLWAASS